MKRTLLSWILTVCMILALIPITAFAEGDDDTVTIASDADWADFCTNAAENATKNVNITADFCTNGTRFSEPYTGTVNGNGHTVTFGATAAALFSDFSGTASDLILGNNSDASMLSDSTSGATVGAFANQITRGTTVLRNIENRLCIVVTKGSAAAGGLVGIIKGTDTIVQFIQCENNATTAQSSNAKNRGVSVKVGTGCGGGLVGKVSGTNVSLSFIRCENNGYVHSVDGGCCGIGGFVGFWYSTSGNLTFDRCLNTNMYDYVKGTIGVKGHIGGFLGRGPESLTDNTLTVSLIKCANKADIQATSLMGNSKFPCDLGGFLSHTAAKDISFVGCYNSGNLSYVNATKTALVADTNVEIAGFAAGCKANTLLFENCYNKGTLNSANYATEEGETITGFTLRCSTGAFTGSFTQAAVVTFTKDAGNLDLTASGTLSDVAALDYGTLYNADGSHTWETSCLTTMSGARIRTNTPTGLRFDSSVPKADYDKLKQNYASVTFGTVIAPLAYVEEAGCFTKTALDGLGHSVNYLNVVWTDADLKLSQDGQSMEFNGSVVEIAEKNYELQYVARGYILCKTAGNEEILIWADYEDSFFHRSVYQVAKSALSDPQNGLSSGAVTVISGIVATVDGKNN